MSKPEVRTLRYASGVTGWTVHDLGAPAVYLRGPPGTEPEWLQRILTVARISGYLMEVPPPPHCILWFRATDTHELVGFTE